MRGVQFPISKLWDAKGSHTFSSVHYSQYPQMTQLGEMKTRPIWNPHTLVWLLPTRNMPCQPIAYGGTPGCEYVKRSCCFLVVREPNVFWAYHFSNGTNTCALWTKSYTSKPIRIWVNICSSEEVQYGGCRASIVGYSLIIALCFPCTPSHYM